MSNLILSLLLFDAHEINYQSGLEGCIIPRMAPIIKLMIAIKASKILVILDFDFCLVFYLVNSLIMKLASSNCAVKLL